MKKIGSIIFSIRSRWLVLGVAGMLVIGPQSVSAQTFGDFESGMDGFFGSDNSLRTNLTMVGTNVVTNLLNTVTNATLPGLATSGSNVISVIQIPSVTGDDNFDWSLEVSALSNATFAAAISNAVMDTNAFYDIFFDGIYTVAGFPEAGTTNGPTFMNHLMAMVLPATAGGWDNAPFSPGPSGSQLGTNFTSDFTVELVMRVEDFSNMTPANILAASNNISLLVALNGNWPTNGVSNDAQMYYDNFRIVEWDGLLYDFESGLQGWFANACAGSVVWAEDEPATGINAMRLLTSGAGICRGCGVIMTPGQHAYTVMRNLIRYQDPSDHVLKLDMVIDTGVLNNSATFIRPSLSWDLTTLEQVTVVDTNVIPAVTNMYFTNVVTSLGPFTYEDNTIFVSNLVAGITSVPLELPLNVFSWPNDSQYDPLSIQLNLGHEVDGSGFPLPLNRIYYDNIEIGIFNPLLAEKVDITSMSKVSSNVNLTWTSQEADVDFFGNVTPIYYGVERSADLVGDVWLPVSSNLPSAFPSDTTDTFSDGGTDEEYYRVNASFTFLLEELLWNFEGTNDISYSTNNIGWRIPDDLGNPPEYVTNSSVVATSGTNSMAIPWASGSSYWGYMVTVNSGSVQYLDILDALNDVSNNWHMSFDIIWHGPDLQSVDGFCQVPFAWNSDTGGWQQSTEAGTLGGGNVDLIKDLETPPNTIVRTFTQPLSDSGWAEHATSNDFWNIHMGVQFGGDDPTNNTLYIDNIKLTTQEVGLNRD